MLASAVPTNYTAEEFKRDIDEYIGFIRSFDSADKSRMSNPITIYDEETGEEQTLRLNLDAPIARLHDTLTGRYGQDEGGARRDRVHLFVNLTSRLLPELESRGLAWLEAGAAATEGQVPEAGGSQQVGDEAQMCLSMEWFELVLNLPRAATMNDRAASKLARSALRRFSKVTSRE